MELFLGNQGLLLLFPLAQDRSSFFGELSQRRASLEGLKMLALPQTPRPCPQHGENAQGEDQPPGPKLRYYLSLSQLIASFSLTRLDSSPKF